MGIVTFAQVSKDAPADSKAKLIDMIAKRPAGKA
jgi:hypothetical protein